MGQEALREVRRDVMRKRLAFLVSAVEDATYELWRGELGYAAAEKLTHEIRKVRAEVRALRTKLALGDAMIPPIRRPSGDRTVCQADAEDHFVWID